eukprot:PhM_4_TR14660/c0_g1_i1/m.35425
MTEEVRLDCFNCLVTHTPYNVTVMQPFMPFNGAKRGHNFNAKMAWKGAIQGIRALNRLKGVLGTKLRPDLVLITGHERGNMQVRNIDQCEVTKSATHYNNVKVTNIVVTNSYVYATTEKDMLKGKHGDDTDLYVWDLNTMHIVEKLEGHEERIVCVAVCEYNENISVTGSIDRTIIVWDLKQKNKLVHRLKGHTMMINKVLITKGYVYSAGADATVRAWDIEKGQMIASYEGHTGPLLYMGWAVSPLEKGGFEAATLLTGCGGGTLREWGVTPQGGLKARWTTKPHNGQITDVCDDGPIVITAGSDNILSFYHRSNNLSTRVSRPETAAIRILDLDLARKYLLSGTDAGHIMLWDYSSMLSGAPKEDDLRLLITLTPHTSAITSIVLERDMKGKWERILSSSLDNTLFTIDFVTDRDSTTYKGVTAKHNVQLPTGSVITALDHRAVVWDLFERRQKGKSKDTLQGHTGAITGIQFANELDKVLTASDDGTIRMWDVALFSEKEMQHEELMQCVHTETVGMSVRCLSNVVGEVVAYAGSKPASRAGTITILEITTGQSLGQINLSFIPHQIAMPNADEVLVQHRSGEVMLYRKDGTLIRSTARDDSYEGGDAYPPFVYTIDTNWDPPHVIVAVADNKHVRCVDLTADRSLWSTVHTSPVTGVALLGQANMAAVIGTRGGEVIIIDDHGHTLYEVLPDGGAINKQAEESNSSLVSRRRRSMVDASALRAAAQSEAEAAELLHEGVSALSVNLDARYIAVGYTDGTLLLFDTATRRTVRRMKVGGVPQSIYLYPKERRMFTVLDDGSTVRIDTLYSRVDRS